MTMSANRQLTTFNFFLTNDNHEGNLLDFRIADLPTDLFIPIVNEGANIGHF